MATDEEIYAKLTSIFHELFEDEAIVLHPETTANDVESWDSCNNVTLMVAVEKRFGIRVTTTEIESFRCVGDLVAAIHRKLA